MENGESAEAGAEPAPEADVGLFDVGAIDGKVCTPAAVSAVVEEEWVKFNLDTGAAQTAVPKDWVKDKVTVTGASEVIFKTASGELVPSEGTGTFEGFGESGMRCRVRGAIADVHKPLVSAHKCLGFGRIAVLDENGGQLVPVNSKAGRAIQGIINRSRAAEVKTWLPVYQEKGVYNFYLRTKGRKRQASAVNTAEMVTKELNAASDEPEARAVPAEGEIEEVMEEVEESERPKLVKAPDTPTQAEIDEHEAMGHVVYRDWCRHCIAGRAIGQPHRTRTDEQRARNLVPTIVLDYAFMSRSDEDDERLRPILVMKDERTQMVAATFVDSKGATPYAVKFAAAFLKNLGYRKVVMKSDGEHSIVALKEAAAREAAIESVPEESPVGDHQANGLAENAIREVKRQIRVLRSALEESIGRVLSDEDPVLAWLPRQAADLLCRYKKGTDGRTPEVRRSGKQWRKPAIAFGERLYFREVGEGTRVLKEGRYVGHHGRTGSLMLITPEGVKRGTGFRRMPSADRWDPAGWDQLRGIPWEHAAPRPAIGERFISEDRLIVPPPPPEERVAPPQRRRIYIRKEDVHKHGATEGCPGCNCVLEDRRTTVPHTEACRARIIEAMEKDEAGAERLQTYAKKRKESQASQRPKPRVVASGEQDLSVEDAAGIPPEQAAAPAVAQEVPEDPAEIPEDPGARAELKRQSMPASSSAQPRVKAKTAPQSVKRTGEMKMASAPPLTKARPAPPCAGASTRCEAHCRRRHRGFRRKDNSRASGCFNRSS